VESTRIFFNPRFFALSETVSISEGNSPLNCFLRSGKKMWAVLQAIPMILQPNLSIALTCCESVFLAEFAWLVSEMKLGIERELMMMRGNSSSRLAPKLVLAFSSSKK